MNTFFTYLLLFLLGGNTSPEKPSQTFPIKWENKLDADFRFTQKWQYPEGVYHNQFGQLSCDGMCPVEIDEMKDEKGKIREKSLKAFYKIVDTTHQYFSLESETNVPEFFTANLVEVKRQGDRKIRLISERNASTHSRLIIEIDQSDFSAWIDYNSITTIGRHQFELKSGSLRIEKASFHKGILKAEFDFSFENYLDQGEEIYWKGKIYKEMTL